MGAATNDIGGLAELTGAKADASFASSISSGMLQASSFNLRSHPSAGARALPQAMTDATNPGESASTPQTKPKKVRLACQRCRDRRIKVDTRKTPLPLASLLTVRPV